MPRSNFGQVIDGIAVSGVTINLHQKGKVFYVNNSTVAPPLGNVGSDSNTGTSINKPLATIAKAFTKVVANRGDKVVVGPGHAETVSAAAGIDLSVAGVDVIGVGKGSLRPTITLDTANTATVQVSASNISISNILFKANFLNIATCIKLKNATIATDFKANDCEFRDNSAVLNFVKGVSTSTTDNNNDGLEVTNISFNGTGTSAATSLVNAGGAVDRLRVENCKVNVQGTTATTGALILATSKALTAVYVGYNVVNSPITTSAAGALIVAGTGGSGVVEFNYVNAPAAATAIMCTTGTGLGFRENKISRSAADTSGILLPAVST